MSFASFFSGEFITTIVVNPMEKKVAKRTSVYGLVTLNLFQFMKNLSIYIFV